MNSKELNQKLVVSLPELKSRYQAEVDWQDGDETGSHVVYGDVLAPVMESLLRHGDYGLAHKYFDFLENLLLLNDEYAEEVVSLSVIEYLYYSDLDRAAVKAELGDGCRRLWEEFEEFDRNQGIGPK